MPVERAVLRAAYSALPAFVLSSFTVIAVWLELNAATAVSIPGAHDQKVISTASPVPALADSAGAVAVPAGGTEAELPAVPEGGRAATGRQRTGDEADGGQARERAKHATEHCLALLQVRRDVDSVSVCSDTRIGHVVDPPWASAGTGRAFERGDSGRTREISLARMPASILSRVSGGGLARGREVLDRFRERGREAILPRRLCYAKEQIS